jgi:endo-1,4-beta-xylanase
MHITGHCLIWHSQLPHWFCTDEQGHNVSPDVLRQRMKAHISTVVGRYKGRVKGWDVVNEAIMEDGSYRKSKFYEILGEEFIPLAFQYAHEADPEAELYYNDYNMYFPGKREAVCRLVKQLRERGLRIDAVGMQGHIDLHHPSLEEFEKSIETYAGAGVKVMITEFDMSALPSPWHSANISDTLSYEQRMNPYVNGLPDSISAQWNARMMEFMQLFIRHADVITRVTAWGVTDGNSWKNGFPIRGRTDYPLFFDRQYRPKPFIEELIRGKK